MYYASKKLTQKQIKYLIDLPDKREIVINDKKVFMCHGSPWNRDAYIYPDSQSSVIDRMFNYDPSIDILIYGHTHYPALWEKGDRKIVNPGSVGQPRNRIAGASWAVWNTKNNKITFRVEKYPINKVIETCKIFDPKTNYLTDVLTRS